jgi:hypothetical protein
LRRSGADPRGDFNSDAGFVNRNDIVSGRAFNRFTLYGRRGALLETFQLFAGVTRIWRYDDFLERGGIEGEESASMMSRWRGGWQVNSEIERTFVDFDPATYPPYTTQTSSGPQPFSPLPGVSGPGVSLTITTPTFRLIDATARVQRNRSAIFSEASEGTSTSITGGVSLRPNESLRIAATNTFQRITRTRDGSEFARAIIPRVKAEYQPTRALFFRTIAEYRSERRDRLEDARSGLPLTLSGNPVPATSLTGLRLDLLASYEPTPGTVAFLGYGTTLRADELLPDSDLVRMSDGFFLKLAYQFRR